MTAKGAPLAPGPDQSLADWLAWQESLHPAEIALGLERCRAVAEKLGILHPGFTVVTVAGTNGKGSTVAMLDATYRCAGYRVGTYTSPHLLRYNERIRLDGIPVADAVICAAFARVEAARAGIALTFFEFGTLAALVIFADAGLDLAILEVGMGGRLDAVNLVDPDVAVIATLDIDHVEFLGHTRDEIAREKAGILRAGRPAVCSDPEPPQSLLDCAASQGTSLALLGRDFCFEADEQAWTWWSGREVLSGLPRPALSGAYQFRNAAGVLKVLSLLGERHPVTPDQIATALREVRLQGRFQRIAGEIDVILDVAHNAQAMAAFVSNLEALPRVAGTRVVLGMLRTKDHLAAMRTLAPFVDHWHFATVAAARGASANDLLASWQGLRLGQPAHCHASVEAAWRVARDETPPGGRILVVGSFVTVGEVLRIISPDNVPSVGASP